MTNNTSLIDWLSFTLPTAYSWHALALNKSVHPLIFDLFGLKTPGANVTLGKGKWYKERHTISSATGKPLIHVYLDPTAETTPELPHSRSQGTHSAVAPMHYIT